METGIIRQLPSGEFIEETRPVNEELRAVLEWNRVGAPQLPAAPPKDADEVPAPADRGPLGRLRGGLNRVITEGIPIEGDGHGDGHGNGHAARAAVSAGEQGATPAEQEQSGTDGGETGH